MKGFCNKFYAFKPKSDDVEKAFLLLLKNNLIKPIMEFRGETRYILADKMLYDLITDIKLLDKIQRDVDYILDHYESPSLEQIEKRKILYSDDSLLKQFFNKRELNRFEFRRTVKEEKGNIEILQWKKKIENYKKEVEGKKSIVFDCIKEKHEKTFKEYGFLSDIIRTFCPLL